MSSLLWDLNFVRIGLQYETQLTLYREFSSNFEKKNNIEHVKAHRQEYIALVQQVKFE